MGCREVQQLDARLARLAREESALRLRLGQLFEVLGRGPVFDLGFSSLAAYAVERCERSGRWADGARCLVRRVEELPQLRRAIAAGRVSWSMGELLARVAKPGDEARWVELASSRTVRKMRGLVAAALEEARNGVAKAVVGVAGASEPVGGVGEGDVCTAGDEACTMRSYVLREEAWLFEATRTLLDQLGERSAEEQCEALLAEAHGALLDRLPAGAFDPDSLDPDSRAANADAQRRWVGELARWREQAELMCERNIAGHLADHLSVGRAQSGSSPSGEGSGREGSGREGSVALDAALGLASLEQASASELDRQVRVLSGALARHELELAQAVLQFHRAGGWRQLGYATEAQYARERLGASLSSQLARRALALRLEALPGVTAALGSGQIGVEAAMQLVRVATPNTEAAWVARATQRTVKHLREEVAAARVAVRWSGEGDCPPPTDREVTAFQILEQAVVGGGIAQGLSSANEAACVLGECAARVRRLVEPASSERRAWCVMLGSLAEWLDGGFQTSAATGSALPSRPTASAGRVTLRLRMSRETRAWWRALEALARHWLPPGMSWLRFACLSVWAAWGHQLGADLAYGHIYVRDRYRCLSPVCGRRDVTPHHLRFRSAGGTDEDDNVGSICTWCHLRGVHGGRIRARGTAALIHWELGPAGSPCVVVHGRERQAAA